MDINTYLGMFWWRKKKSPVPMIKRKLGYLSDSKIILHIMEDKSE